MKKFTVNAYYKTYYTAVVESEDGDAANKKAIMEMDQSDFISTGDGDWYVENEEPAEEIKPSHWDVDPDYPVEDWQAEVANDDTRQSYAEWVISMREMLEEIQLPSLREEVS